MANIYSVCDQCNSKKCIKSNFNSITDSQITLLNSKDWKQRREFVNVDLQCLFYFYLEVKVDEPGQGILIHGVNVGQV